MVAPISTLPGYNPNATYLPPGFAAPSSYPERVAPTKQFYEMPKLPSVAPQNASEFAGTEFNGTDPNSAMPTQGIVAGVAQGFPGQIWGDTNFYDLAGMYNNVLRQPAQSNNSRQLAPFDIQPSGLSENDLYQLSQLPSLPGFDLNSFARPKTTSVSAQEDGFPLYSATGQSPYGGYSWGDGLTSSFPLQPFDIQPSPLTQSQIDQLGRLPSLPESPDRTWNTVGNIASMLTPFGNIFNAGYGFVNGLEGNRLPSNPDSSFLQDLVDPSQPGLVAKGFNWLGRQFAGDSGMSDAEKSAAQAYSVPAYQDASGKWAVPDNWSYDPNATNTNTLATMQQLMAGSPGSNTADFVNYYDQGNYSLMPAMGNLNFGASRFSTLDHGGAFNPGTMNGTFALGDSQDDPIFGPLARFVQGNRFDTN